MFKKAFRPTQPDFHSRTRAARKLLVVDIGGLGDVVHALPALWAIRQSYPQAQLHCVVRGHLVALLRIAPWIDHVWPYHGKKKSVRGHDLAMARLIHAQGYDLSINLMGTNRSCIIGRVTGAPHRLGRRPAEDDRDGWRWLNTEVMDYPYRLEPRYLQKWKCLAQAGITAEAPSFPIEAGLAPLPADIEQSDRGGYLHLSPGTSDALRELPTAQLVELLGLLKKAFPALKIVLSGADNPREKALFEALLAQLPFRPWRAYNGTLDAAELFGLIRDAALHLSGDTGTMHLAWLAGTPSVSWFRAGSSPEWQPQGARHRSLFAASEAPDQLRGLDNAAVIDAARRLLEGPAADA
jgi:heptosyltransferase-1/heptosyltransferase-2